LEDYHQIIDIIIIVNHKVYVDFLLAHVQFFVIAAWRNLGGLRDEFVKRSDDEKLRMCAGVMRFVDLFRGLSERLDLHPLDTSVGSYRQRHEMMQTFLWVVFKLGYYNAWSQYGFDLT
jgi:hypothetical protein